MRVYVLDEHNNRIDYLDSNSDKVFWDATLTEYLSGNSATLKLSSAPNDSLKIGNKITFNYNNKSYYFNIVKTEEDEQETTIECYSLVFDFLNEYANPFPTGAKQQNPDSLKFMEYLYHFEDDSYDWSIIKVGTNQIPDRTRALVYDGVNDTLLNRIYQLANDFDAEIEFIPILKDDATLNYIQLNIYQKHNDKYQGMGEDRTDVVLRYDKDIKTIERTLDITTLYTAFRPYGQNQDGSSIDLLNKQLYVYTDGTTSTTRDANKVVEFYTEIGNRNVFAPLAATNFPSSPKDTKGYITKKEFTQINNEDKLLEYAFEEIKKNSTPIASYSIDGIFNVNIGDTITISDYGFRNPLFLKTRVAEKETDIINDLSYYKLDNSTEIASNISSSLKETIVSSVVTSAKFTGSGWETPDPTENPIGWRIIPRPFPLGQDSNQSKLKLETTESVELVDGLELEVDANGFVFYAEELDLYLPKVSMVRYNDVEYPLMYQEIADTILGQTFIVYMLKNYGVTDDHTGLKTYMTSPKAFYKIVYQSGCFVVKEMRIKDSAIVITSETTGNWIYNHDGATQGELPITTDLSERNAIPTAEAVILGLNSKQNILSTAQMKAVNSGITSEKVSQYDGYATDIASKVDKLNTSGTKVYSHTGPTQGEINVDTTVGNNDNIPTNNAIISYLSDFVVKEYKTVGALSNKSINANGFLTLGATSVSLAKTGYSVLGIVGNSFGNTNITPTALYVNSSEYLQCSLRNVASSTQTTGTAGVYVLYYKN